MKLKIAPNDVQSMVQDGDAILRSLQNNNLSIIDLIVRESLQNSLDATLEDAKITNVDFYYDKFNSEKLSNHLEGISDILSYNYLGEQKFLAISDKNTNGLTGDYKSEDQNVLNKSNFHKLVFGIGKNQDKEGAGGSWGLGKTSYFRAGIGIVIYYTRIKINDFYEERLIVSLIESPKQKDRLLKKSDRGIAWWGEYDETGSKIYPITNKNVIEEILKLFNLKSYKDNETGTTIIIPYFKETINENIDEEIDIYPWERNVEDALNIAIQRWYSPRIWNEKYNNKLGNSMLNCSVNNNKITPITNIEPTFNIFRDLYTSALINEPLNQNIKVKPIFFPRHPIENKKIPVGYLAFCEVSPEDLKMNSPENKASGLAYIGVRDKNLIKNNNSKVLAYARKPGMIVEYNVDGDWTPKGFNLDEKKMLFSFFVPSSEAELIDKFKNLGHSNIENYLRATENADHAQWVDEDGVGIINRMKTYTIKAITEEFQDPSANEHTNATSGLSRKYGAIFMPPRNFGKTSAKKSEEKTGVRNVESRNRKSDISILESNPIDNNTVEVKVKAFIKNNTKCNVFLQVLTQEQKLDVLGWKKAMGEHIKFPFDFKEVFINKIEDKTIEQDIRYLQLNGVSFEFNEFGELLIDVALDKDIEIEFTNVIHSYNKQYLPNIAIKTITSEKGEK